MLVIYKSIYHTLSLEGKKKEGFIVMNDKECKTSTRNYDVPIRVLL